MNYTRIHRWARSGHTLVKLAVIVTVLGALLVVIKTFVHAAECYADAAETIAAIGEDNR